MDEEKGTVKRYPVRSEILMEAANIIANDRNVSYGEPRENLLAIRLMKDAYKRARELYGIYSYSPEHEEAMEMVLFKIGRIASGVPKADNYVDLCGYAGIAGELRGKQ